MSGDWLLVGGYFGLLGLLGALGVHRLYLVIVYLTHRGRRPEPGAEPLRWPTVTVQLPVFNEPLVVDRLLRAVAEFDYPGNRLEVQVLDDSTDDTSARVAASVSRLRRSGMDITHLRRTHRHGFKAGALAAGLKVARGEFIAIFDSDFVPTADFLRRTLVYFDAPDIGMVQVRWEHLNRNYSLLTRVQALLLDAHFAIEHAARNLSGRFFNFNGTAGIWRRAAIEAAGGWQHDTLTEDLDLSYRAQLNGWRFRYVDCPAAPAELPVSIAAFKSQQHRWTKGAVQTARKMLGQLWSSPEPLAVKIEGTIQLTANVAYPLMLGVSVLVFPAMIVRRAWHESWLLWIDLPILVFATGSVCVFFLLAQREIGRPWWREVLRMPALMALGIGMSLSNSLAVLQGLRGPAGEFVRTPKLAVLDGGSPPRRRSGRATSGWLLTVEMAFAIYFSAAAVLAVQLGMWAFLPFLMLFQAGYVYTVGLSLGERIAALRGAANTPRPARTAT